MNFNKKHCLQVVTLNENNLSKQVVPITHWRKGFSQLLYSEGLRVVSFQIE